MPFTPTWTLLQIFASLVGFALLSISCGVEAALSTQLDVVIDPPAETLLRGDTAIATLTLTNTGDEPLDSATVGFTYRGFGPLSTLFPFITTETLPCSIRFDDFSVPPGVPPFIGISGVLFPRPIPPGESRQCVIGIEVSEQTAHPFVKTFGSSASSSGQTAFSSYPVTFTLGEQPTPVPVSSWWSLVAMGTLLLLLGVFRCSR